MASIDSGASFSISRSILSALDIAILAAARNFIIDPSNHESHVRLLQRFD